MLSGGQFYSDSSSEEFSSGEDEELWNPNEMIDQISKIENQVEREEKKVKLLENFLDQRRPFLTTKMKGFLSEDGVFETMMNYVIRMNESPPPSAIKLDNLSSPPSGSPGRNKRKAKQTIATPQPRPLTTPQTDKFVRRSFNVTEIFVNPSDELDEIIENKLETILRLLFKSLEPNSSANLYHFEKILDSILARNPVEATKFLIGQNLFWTLFDSLHENPIVDALLALFTCEFNKQSDTIHFYKSLVEAKLFDKIGEKIFTKGSISAMPVAEFFVKLIDRLASFEMSGILFIALVRAPVFIQTLFAVVCNKSKEYPEIQQRASAMVIRELLVKSGEKMYDQSDLRPLPNMLSAIHDKLHELAKPYANDLAELLVSHDKGKSIPITYSSYVVIQPLGLFRFTLMEILSDIVTSVPDIVMSFSPNVWKVLCDWFIDYSNNNMYQCLFYKIFEVVVHHNYDVALRVILHQCKFLSRLVAAYEKNSKIPSRGFIINLINILRLAADLQPVDGYLRHHLKSHIPYQNILPDIREESLRQLKRYQDLEGLEEEGEDDIGIELGSAFARSLGFDQDPPLPTEKKKKKKKSKEEKASNRAVPKQPVEHLKPELKNPDDDSDPKDSAATWWTSLKVELENQDKKEDVDNSWWDSLKEELEKK